MSRDDSLAWAAYAIACALFAWALPRPGAPPPACPAPREAAGQGGHTTEVRCDGRGPPLRGPARLLFGMALDPNRADPGTLETLPGIGPVRAAAIVAEREQRPFRDVSELRRVAGIGPVTLRNIAPWLAIAVEEPGEALLQQNR